MNILTMCDNMQAHILHDLDDYKGMILTVDHCSLRIPPVGLSRLVPLNIIKPFIQPF